MEEMEDMGGMEDNYEMEMMGGDLGGSYGGGGSRSRASGTPQSDAMQTYASSLTALMGGMDLMPLFVNSENVIVDTGPVLQREAEQAFQSGHQALARELMFGHMVAEYEHAEGAIRSVKYSGLLRRPVWNIRWGISMAIRGDDGLVDAMPIRETTTGTNLAGNSQMRPGGMRPGGMRPGGTGSEFGMEEMSAGMEEGMGEFEMQGMEEMYDSGDMMEMEGGSFGRPGSPRPAAPPVTVRKMLSDEAGAAISKKIGLVGEVTAAEFQERFARGQFGVLFSQVTPPVTVEPERGFGRGNQAAAPPPTPRVSEQLDAALTQAGEPLPMWKPGIVFLGINPTDVAIPKAREKNIDLILHFDVVLKMGRNEQMQNICRCRLLNVATGKSFGVSKAMDNWEAAQLASAGRMGERAYIQQQMANLWGIVDREVNAIELPKLTPEVARRRIASLIGGPESRTLRTLAEIRLYQAQGLIDESDVEVAFDIVGGSEGLMFLHGPAHERVGVARRWAVETQTTANP